MEIKKLIAEHERLHLTPLPTPLEFAPNLTALLGGPRIYIKRGSLPRGTSRATCCWIT